MLAAVKGYYDGRQIVIAEADQKSFNKGDEVIVTILKRSQAQVAEARASRRRKIIDNEDYVLDMGRTAEEIDAYVREMRRDDRF